MSDHEPTITVESARTTDAVEVVVRDSGIGIPSEDIYRILEPLYSTKARGLGLGLAIARSILDKNRGSMRLTSEIGKGSSFTVRLTAVLP